MTYIRSTKIIGIAELVNANSYTFSNLDGDRDSLYKLEFDVEFHNYPGGDLGLRINGFSIADHRGVRHGFYRYWPTDAYVDVHVAEYFTSTSYFTLSYRSFFGFNAAFRHIGSTIIHPRTGIKSVLSKSGQNVITPPGFFYEFAGEFEIYQINYNDLLRAQNTTSIDVFSTNDKPMNGKLILSKLII